MKMQAAVLHSPGDLRVEQIPVPESLDPKEVLVKVMAAGICGSDIDRVMHSGTYEFPMVPGHEFSGLVEETGDNVDGLRKGDKVVVAPLMPCFNCRSCYGGHYSLCDQYSFLGSRTNGGFAQFVKAPAMNVLRMPENVEFTVGATIEPAAIALHGINLLTIRPGDAVAVIGCGALGFFAVQFAKISGAAPVIAIDIDPEKLGLASAVGADECIDASTANVIDAVKNATAKEGVNFALETAGINTTREQCLEIVKKRGEVLLLGTAHDEVVFSPATFEKVIRYELVIRGSWNSYSIPFPGREWFTTLNYLKTDIITADPLISHVFELGEAPKVFKDLYSRTLKSHKVIFTPNGQ
jgi:L-iditol 2-dehydrogenase